MFAHSLVVIDVTGYQVVEEGIDESDDEIGDYTGSGIDGDLDETDDEIGDYIGSGCKPMRINGVEYTVKSCEYGDELDLSSENKVNFADLYEPILDWSLNLGCQEAEEDFLGIPRKHDVWEEIKMLKEEIFRLERSLKTSGNREKGNNGGLKESRTN